MSYIYSFTDEQLDEYSNRVKEVILKKLRLDEVINKDQEIELSKTLVLINKPLGTISKIYQTIFGKDSDKNQIICAKMNPYEKGDEDEQE